MRGRARGGADEMWKTKCLESIPVARLLMAFREDAVNLRGGEARGEN